MHFCFTNRGPFEFIGFYQLKIVDFEWLLHVLEIDLQLHIFSTVIYVK